MARQRIDGLLAQRGLFASRSQAAAAVIAGQVLVGPDGERARKPGQLVAEDTDLAVAERPKFVSRGGTKLANALDALGIDVSGRLCLDVGASTGGFTDCLLQRGAERVIAVDVAYGELDWGLRNDSRVVVVERTNARHLGAAELPFDPDLCTIDVSFISLEKVLGPVVSTLAPDSDVLAMVKPQFEVGRERIGKGGVVRDASARRDALIAVGIAASGVGLRPRGYASSGLPGPKGNRETFLWCDTREGAAIDLEAAATEVEP